MDLHHSKLMGKATFKCLYVDYFNCSGHGIKIMNKLTAGFHFIQGPRGPSGLQGPPGIPGNCVTPSSSNTTIPPVFCLPGKPGLKGARGETGKRGSQGPQGPRGNKGPRGSKGSEGPHGKKGDPGPPGDFAGLTCLPRYTGWVDRGDWISEQPEVHCDRREFLQGFSLEENKARGQRRFKYTCCALRLTVPGQG